MERLNAEALPDGSLLLVDSAPLIYVLEDKQPLAARFMPLFTRFDSGHLRLAVSTISIAEVLAGPLKAGAEDLVQRYRAALECMLVVTVDADIAESAARLRCNHGLKLPDAIQLACALAIDADALVTHDRDFLKVSGIRVLA
jgi:predicted nucleic acid-binding protein